MRFSSFIEASKNRDLRKKVKLARFAEPFEIRTLTEDETTALRKQYTRTKKNSKGIEIPDLDANAYSRAVTALSVTYPDLSDAEFQKELGTEGSTVDTLGQLLLAGEYQTLQSAVMDFSGFNDDLEEVKDEVKNELTQAK